VTKITNNNSEVREVNCNTDCVVKIIQI